MLEGVCLFTVLLLLSVHIFQLDRQWHTSYVKNVSNRLSFVHYSVHTTEIKEQRNVVSITTTMHLLTLLSFSQVEESSASNILTAPGNKHTLYISAN